MLTKHFEGPVMERMMARLNLRIAQGRPEIAPKIAVDDQIGFEGGEQEDESLTVDSVDVVESQLGKGESRKQLPVDTAYAVSCGTLGSKLEAVGNLRLAPCMWEGESLPPGLGPPRGCMVKPGVPMLGRRGEAKLSISSNLRLKVIGPRVLLRITGLRSALDARAAGMRVLDLRILFPRRVLQPQVPCAPTTWTTWSSTRSSRSTRVPSPPRHAMVPPWMPGTLGNLSAMVMENVFFRNT